MQHLSARGPVSARLSRGVLWRRRHRENPAAPKVKSSEVVYGACELVAEEVLFGEEAADPVATDLLTEVEQLRPAVASRTIIGQAEGI